MRPTTPRIPSISIPLDTRVPPRGSRLSRLAFTLAILAGLTASASCSDRSLSSDFGHVEQGLESQSCSLIGQVAISRVEQAEHRTYEVKLTPSTKSAVSFDFDGAGVRFDKPTESSTRVECAWMGLHDVTVKVTAKTPKSVCEDSAVVTVDCMPNPPAVSDADQGVAVSIEDPTQLSCPLTDVVARTSGACPLTLGNAARGTWAGEALVDDPDQSEATMYCAYSWEGTTSQPPDTALLDAAFADWQPDCPNVALSGSLRKLNRALIEKSRAQLGVVQLGNNVARKPVNVAVVDTQSSDWHSGDVNPHGAAVGAVVHDTACPDSTDCPIGLRYYLAMPMSVRAAPTAKNASRVVVTRDFSHGGNFGPRRRLARAILDVVRDMDESEARTIINLSLGWDQTEVNNGTRAVLESLKRARCKGALIFAAAGNGTVPASDQGPIYPAGWTTLAAPQPDACARRGYAESASNSTGPLLFAVSGLGFDQQPLMTTRGDGQATLAALGFAAVRDDGLGGYTQSLTGSSMATAAVSGIAALQWSLDSSLTPLELVKALVDGSPTLVGSNGETIHSDFQPYGYTSSEVRRLTRCSVQYPSGSSCAIGDSSATLLANIPNPVTAVPASESEEAVVFSQPSVDPAAVPWVYPTPDPEPACTVCRFQMSNRLFWAELRPTIDLASLSSIRLVRQSGETLRTITAPSRSFSLDLTADETNGLSQVQLLYQLRTGSVVADLSEPAVLEQ